MTPKSILAYLWKLPLCGVAFFVAMAVGGAVLPLTGLQAPDMPAGTDANTVALYFLLASLILAIALSLLSRGMGVGWAARWLVLGFFSWAWNGISMVLEASAFMNTGAVSSGGSMLFTMLNMLLPSLALAGMVAWLFPPVERGKGLAAGLRALFAAHPGRAWAWRLPLAIVAFPAIYIVCGLAVRPFIEVYYATGAYELSTPSWAQIISLQLVRSLLFLLASLPVLAAWRGSLRGLALGLAVFVLVAFMPVISAYWFPWQLRVYHGLELAADSFLYAGALVALLVRRPAVVA